MAQVRPVTSEALEAQIRDLLPSQNGFSEDLQATNVITPIIDLTATAEGTTTPQMLQTALAFGSQTAFDAFGTTTTLANTPGFWLLTGAVYSGTTSTSQEIDFSLSDGLSTKQIAAYSALGNVEIQIIVFLRAGDSFTTSSPSNNFRFRGSIRQIADVNGNLINPVGFTPQ